MVPPLRIELRFERYECPVLPLNYGGKGLQSGLQSFV